MALNFRPFSFLSRPPEGGPIAPEHSDSGGDKRFYPDNGPPPHAGIWALKDTLIDYGAGLRRSYERATNFARQNCPPEAPICQGTAGLVGFVGGGVSEAGSAVIEGGRAFQEAQTSEDEINAAAAVVGGLSSIVLTVLAPASGTESLPTSGTRVRGEPLAPRPSTGSRLRSRFGGQAGRTVISKVSGSAHKFEPMSDGRTLTQLPGRSLQPVRLPSTMEGAQVLKPIPRIHTAITPAEAVVIPALEGFSAQAPAVRKNEGFIPVSLDRRQWGIMLSSDEGVVTPADEHQRSSMNARILEIIGNRQSMRSQGEALRAPNGSPIPSKGPLAPWISHERQEIMTELLPKAQVVTDILFELMGQSNEMAVQNGAVDLAIELAGKTPFVYQGILTNYPAVDGRTMEGSSFVDRLLWILQAKARDPLSLATLDRLHMKHPDDSRRFDALRMRNFVVMHHIDVQPRAGRDHVIVAAVSDLHHSQYNADFVQEVAGRVQKLDPDLLIIAGDVANDFEYFQPALELFRGRWPLLVVAGNHDVWSAKGDGGPSSEELWERSLADQAAAAGAVWLEGEPVFIPSLGLAITGTIGWYDYSGDRTHRSHANLAEEKGQSVQDASRIDWEWNDAAFAMTRHHWLRSILEVLSATPDVNEIMVVTHVPPFVELASEREKGDGSEYYDRRSPYYYTPTLGAMIASFPKVRTTVSGHSHLGQKTTILRPGMDPVSAYVLEESDPTTPKQSNEIAVFRLKVTKRN